MTWFYVSTISAEKPFGKFVPIFKSCHLPLEFSGSSTVDIAQQRNQTRKFS